MSLLSSRLILTGLGETIADETGSKKYEHAARDRYIGQIERRPMQAEGMEIEKIGNKAVTATVDDIADGAASNQRKAETLNPDPRSQSEPHDEKGRQQRESDQQHSRKVALCGKEAKADARVVAEAHVVTTDFGDLRLGFHSKFRYNS